jgi:hypothetical protein
VFKDKIETLKRSEYLQIRRAEYATVQLIPTKSNRNNTTSNIASLINKIFLQFSKMINFENKKLIINAQMKVSYYIHITKDETKFYFLIPKIHLNTFKTKFAETWKNVEIKEVEELPININECIKFQLRYKYNDILSLNVDKRSNDLLNANLSVIEILETNESVGVFYNFIPTSERENNYFKILYKDMIKKYKDGDNLKKHKNALDICMMAIKFLLGFIDDFLISIQSQIREKRLVGIKKVPSPSTEKKYHKDILKTQILVIGKADTDIRERIITTSMCNSFKSINDDNELEYKKVKSQININARELSKISINKTTVDECNNFLALPGQELIEQYKSIEHKETKENPVPEELKTGIANLGKIKFKDNKDCAYLSNHKNLKSLPFVIMGGSRSGKSTFGVNLCKNYIDANEGLIVIDFIKNTELAEYIKSITPKDRLIEIDLSNPNHVQSFAYNELKIDKNMPTQQILKLSRMQTNNVLQLVNTINSDDKQLSSKMRKYLGAACRVGFCFPKTSIKNILKILQFHTTRHEYIDNLREDLKIELEESILSLLELDEYSKETKDKKSEVCGTKENKIEGIVDRIDLLRENLVIDSMLAKDPKDNVDFVYAMEQGKVVLIRMRDIDFDDEVSIDILTTFFIQKIWIATKIRGSIHTHPRRCTVLIDEVFQSPTSQKLLTKQFVQSAKFGLKYVLTLHHMDQLSKEAQSSLKASNASYMLISGVDKKAFEILEEEFNIHGYTIDDLLNLKQYQSLNLIKSTDRYEAFITKLPPEINAGIEKLPA